MIHRALLYGWAAAGAAALAISHDAHAQRFPFPQPAPCAGASVVPDAVVDLAAQAADLNRAIDEGKSRIWNRIQAFADAACRAGDRIALETVFDRCIRECRDPGDVYLARIDYGGTLVRFGDTAAAEYQYLRAIEMRPGSPTDAIEAINRYALLLEQQGRPAEALELLNRFSPEELRLYSFPRTLKLWVMQSLGMDVAAEQAALLPPGISTPVGTLPFGTMPGTPDEVPIQPFVIELRGDVSLAPQSFDAGPDAESDSEKGSLYFVRAGSRNPVNLARRVVLAKGQQFTVVATLGGTGCRIEHAGTSYDLVQCPWMNERGDRQGDLYRVLNRRASARAMPPPQTLPVRPPIPLPGAQPVAPGTWARWWGFYGSLARPVSEAQIDTMTTLASRAGLTEAEAALVWQAAEGYLEALETIDTEARNEIAARFQVPVRFERLPEPPTREDGSSRLPVLVPAQLPDGRSVQQVLAEEGFMARVEARKAEALAQHRAQLAELLTPAARAALEQAVGVVSSDIR